ncbi:hypothetical protein [Actinoplanes sp. NBRC 103695]|uniref:hypothetical protein n=1 Tax=Actinoplanes sp. NBRC 103695 TaxID=3032202 RepID=UPI0024A3F0A7|nr:hypothetical protein [Actinoplanes sp. NBRC 103695]GLY96751.1 hypothetical protein Acsp02_40050 [Actinoplanes sp. NBRC 103695]
MERSPADEATASDVVVADLPTSSGAHWANRDRLRSTGEQPMFRRPPASNSFTEEERQQPWDAFGSTPQTPQHAAAEEPAPSDTGSRSRASFGMTDEPISGNWFGHDPSPVSPAGPVAAPSHGYPASSQHQAPDRYQTPAQPEPIAVELPVRTAESHTGTHHWQTQMPMGRGEQPAQEAGAGFFDEQQHHEIRAHRADAAAAHHHQTAPRRSKALTAATVTLTALVLLGGVGAGVAYFSGDDKSLGSVLQLGNDTSDKAEAPDDSVATAPLGNRTSAAFELVAGTQRATVKTQDLGNELYRISSADDSGTAPRPTVDAEKVRLLLEAKGEGARGNVEILLSSKVTWALRFTGGADEQLVDLTGGKLSQVDLTGSSRRVSMTLPRPTGTVQVRIAGAIEDLSLSSPSGSPVRVRVDGGVKTVAAGTRTLRDLEPGSTLTPKDWKTANRYDVAAESRLTLLTVKTLS